jgi:hypothetical protein
MVYVALLPSYRHVAAADRNLKALIERDRRSHRDLREFRRRLADRELEFVPEDAAHGISAYREKLAGLLAGSEISKLPHEQIIAKLDEAGKTFHVLLLKTNMALPYTSVFLQLECGYWNASAEKRLRELIPAP